MWDQSHSGPHMLFIGWFRGEMERIFLMYIFSLTVFSTGQQIQAICTSPEIDAIHLKFPPCPASSLKSDFEVRQGCCECLCPLCWGKLVLSYVEALKACAQVPAAKGLWNYLILKCSTTATVCWNFWHSFLQKPLAFWGATYRGWIEFGSIKLCRQVDPIWHSLRACNTKLHLSKAWTLNLTVTLSH